MERIQNTVQPFDSFSELYKWMKWAGLIKLLKPKNNVQKITYEIYRVISIILVTTYALQHSIYAIQNKDDPDKLFEVIILILPTWNAALKYLSMYFRGRRIQNLIALMEDPIFAAYSYKDEELLTLNTKFTVRLCQIVMTNLSLIAILWGCLPIIKRYNNPLFEVPSYVPFETDTWSMFLLSLALEISPILWVGFGQFAIDVAVATYFSQTIVQLKIIKYNLEHMFDSEELDNTRQHEYIDVIDKNISARFIHFVKRYEKVVWFTKEVNDIFNPNMTYQCFLSTCGLCLVIYKMSLVPAGSLEFIYFVGLYWTIQLQMFLYCYFGSHIEHESNFVTTSVYTGHWVRLSPRFRRQLLIAMTRWIRPISPKLASIIPLTLRTFIQMTRTGYTLFTILKSRNSHNESKQLNF